MRQVIIYHAAVVFPHEACRRNEKVVNFSREGMGGNRVLGHQPRKTFLGLQYRGQCALVGVGIKIACENKRQFSFQNIYFHQIYHAPDLFGTLLAAGLTMLVGIQVFINIAGVMGLIPLKGLALPFLSYGGTAFMMSMMLVGVLLNISANRT